MPLTTPIHVIDDEALDTPAWQYTEGDDIAETFTVATGLDDDGQPVPIGDLTGAAITADVVETRRPGSAVVFSFDVDTSTLSAATFVCSREAARGSGWYRIRVDHELLGGLRTIWFAPFIGSRAG